MVEMTTRTAQKQTLSSAIAFVNMLALGARSARIARINRDHWNPSQFRLVFDEAAQFDERPFRHLVSLRLPEPSPFADAGQVFKADPAFGVCGFLNDLFRDAMIFARFKPAFLAGESFQFSLDILRARALAFHFSGLPTQGSSDLILLLAYLFSLSAGVDIAVIVGGEIHHAEIHADELCRSDLGSFGRVHANEQKPIAVPTAHKVAFSFCQTEPFALIFAHHERNDDAPFQRQNRNPVNTLKRQDAAVIGHGGVGAEDWEKAFIPAVSPSKALHRGFELIGLLFVRQKLNLQSQFHLCALCRQLRSIDRRLSPRRLSDAKFLSTQARRLAVGGEYFGGNRGPRQTTKKRRVYF